MGSVWWIRLHLRSNLFFDCHVLGEGQFSAFSICLKLMAFVLVQVFDVTVQYRGALVSAIYKKTLTLSSLKSRSLGSGVASTYM